MIQLIQIRKSAEQVRLRDWSDMGLKVAEVVKQGRKQSHVYHHLTEEIAV